MKIILAPSDYPRNLKIGESVYHVIFVETAEDDSYGMCDQTNKIIIIALKQDAEEMHRTFWHEILHAAEEELRIKLGHKIIDKLEHSLAQVSLQLYKNK